jgi:hypothetical protein
VLRPVLERGWVEVWQGARLIGTGRDAVAALDGDRRGLRFVTTAQGAEWFRVNIEETR